MSTDAAPAQTVRLITSDNQDMTVDRQVAERSILIKNLLEDLGGDNDEAIPIPNVSTALYPYLFHRRLQIAGQRACHEEGSRVV